VINDFAEVLVAAPGVDSPWIPGTMSWEGDRRGVWASDIQPCRAVPGRCGAVRTGYVRQGPLVAPGDAHWLAEQAEFLARLIGHPAFPAVAGDIVVEFGNARYQDLADAFVGGKPVDGRVLPRIWQQAGGPGQAFTSPIYREFFHTVRAINASRPAGQRTRVLLGDPPIGTCDAPVGTPGRFGIRGTLTSPR